MTKLGMNADVVSSLATQLDGGAVRLNEIISQIENLVNRAANEWRGNDATAFAGWWHSQHKPALQRAHDSIAGLATSARNNVTEQDKISNVVNVHAGTSVGLGHVSGGAQTTGATNSSSGGISDSDFQGAGAEFQRDWQDRGGMDQWNFGYADPAHPGTGDCTSFVAWRLNQLAAARYMDWHFSNNAFTGETAPLPDGRLGNAEDWGSHASAAGFPPDNTPRVGAVAWFGPDSKYGVYGGHVAVVRGIDPTTGAVTLEQSGYDGALYSTVTVSPGSAGYPTGFLHFLPGS